MTKGGHRIANANANLSQAICMKIATINPALRNMKMRIRVHLR
jgi:hypothetical protein